METIAKFEAFIAFIDAYSYSISVIAFSFTTKSIVACLLLVAKGIAVFNLHINTNANSYLDLRIRDEPADLNLVGIRIIMIEYSQFEVCFNLNFNTANL